MKMVSLKQPYNQITKSLLCPQHTQYNAKLYRCTSSANGCDTSVVMIVDIDFCNRNNKKQEGSKEQN